MNEISFKYAYSLYIIILYAPLIPHGHACNNIVYRINVSNCIENWNTAGLCCGTIYYHILNTV